jgi:2-polyprenyl-6-hydroxyphenyl methylase / 3-demethylubiquinone-9 3-methyltransferase
MTFERNDPRQYDTLADEWWNPRGAFAMLHWIAQARARLIPNAPTSTATLLDLGCGGGLMAPFVASKGYHHTGVDITESALIQSQQHGIDVIKSDVSRLPFPDESFDVVCAGEILEHVSDVNTVIAESARVLKPAGLLVLDTIANTALARFLAITVAERVPGAAPRGLHDPSLFVDRTNLVSEYRRHGVDIELKGLRPSIVGAALWLAHRRPSVEMVPTFSTAVLFQGSGRKLL